MAGRRKEMKVTLHLQPPTWGMPTCHPDFLQVASGVHVVLVVPQHARPLARFLALWPSVRPSGARKLLTVCGLAGADVLQGRRSQRQPTKGLASPLRCREKGRKNTLSLSLAQGTQDTRRALPARDWIAVGGWRMVNLNNLNLNVAAARTGRDVWRVRDGRWQGRSARHGH